MLAAFQVFAAPQAAASMTPPWDRRRKNLGRRAAAAKSGAAPKMHRQGRQSQGGAFCELHIIGLRLAKVLALSEKGLFLLELKLQPSLAANLNAAAEQPQFAAGTDFRGHLQLR